MITFPTPLTPSQIVTALDAYIIGQGDAKMNLAIALRGRWRKRNVPANTETEIQPSNILITGPTGVGKTECARRLAKIAQVPFLKIDATHFTERGYVGDSVTSIIPRLVAQAEAIVRRKHEQAVRQRATEHVEEQLLDALLTSQLASPQATDQALPATQGREALREQLRQGLLDACAVHVEVLTQKGGANIIGHGMANEAMVEQMKEMFKRIMPASRQRKRMTVAKARTLLMTQEISELLDMDTIREEACQLAQEEGIIFIDELDKLATTGSKGHGLDVSREGVQRDLLPIVEGTAVSTKYGIVHTDHILFIGAGAFHVAKPSDLIPEFQGRFPIRVSMEGLTQTQLLRIVQEPKNALVKQYQAIFAAEGVTLTLADEALEEVASFAYACNQRMENIGARRLHTIMSQLLHEHLFAVPDTIGPGAQLLITTDYAKERFAKLRTHHEQQRYIL